MIQCGSQIWGVKRYAYVENVHVKFCWLAVIFGKIAMNFAVLNEWGIQPIFVHYHLTAIK